MNNRLKNFYMRIANECARMSRAIRLQVGCVIVKDNNIISFSWNGTPQGWNNDCEYKDYCLSKDFNGNYFPGTNEEYPLEDQYGRYRLKTRPEVLHAERNALDKLAKGNEGGLGSTMFITHAPCLECAKSIYGAGVSQVFYKEAYRTTQGVDFLRQCNIKIEQIKD